MALRLVVGGSGGIGKAFVSQLKLRFPADRIIYTRRNAASAETDAFELDYDRPETIDQCLASIENTQEELAQVIVATGLLHDKDSGPEKTFKDLDEDFVQRVFWINALAPTLFLSKLLQKLDRGSQTQIAVLSARVGSIEDNHLGGWYSYRSSKAALNQMLKTFAIELRRTHKSVQVLALHPGTTDTKLSKPFQARVPKNKLFTPNFAADAMIDVLVDNVGKESGQFLAWDGNSIPW